MPLQLERRPTIGYVVSTWPRLSQTFVLNEILAELGDHLHGCLAAGGELSLAISIVRCE